MQIRRRVLGAVGTGAVVLAGCGGREDAGGADAGTPTGESTPNDEARPTRTPRDPTALAVSGAWPRAGFDAWQRPR